MRFLILFFIALFLVACSREYYKNNDNSEDLTLIKEFTNDQKKKLPIIINDKINWIDIYNINNKIIYVYKVDMIDVDKKIINKIKSVNKSYPKINQICNPIFDIFDGGISIEYKFININNKFLFDLYFDRNICNNLIDKAM